MTLVSPAFDASVADGFAPHRASSVRGRTRARILVAEDDADERWLIATALRADGHEVVEAYDGGRMLVQVAAAYATRDAEPPCDMIISDLRMPVCSGLEILEAVRRARWSTPYIVVTAFADVATRRHIERLGALLFEKPVNLAELTAAARRLAATCASCSRTASYVGSLPASKRA